MVATGTLLTLAVAALASAFMAWSIGAGSSGSTPFAPAVGANAISVIRAGFVVGLLGLAGAILQGANVTEAVGRELILGVSISPVAAIVGLFVAATLVAAGVFRGYPIATAFTVTGAMIGVGLALGGDPAWPKYRQIGILWALTPVLGGASAFAIARLLRHPGVGEQYVVPLLGGLVGVLVANVELSVLGPAGGSASIASAVGASFGPSTGGSTLGVAAVSLAAAGVVATSLYWDASRSPAAAQRRFLLALGGLVAFSAGGSQVGLAVGPLLPLLSDLPVRLPLAVVLTAGGLGLLAGSWTGAPRMIKALAQDYSSLGPRRSIAALIPSFAIAQVAVYFGVPVSFNEIVVSAIVGSGYAAGGSAVSRAKIGYTVLAWIGSFALACGSSYGLYAVVARFV